MKSQKSFFRATLFVFGLMLTGFIASAQTASPSVSTGKPALTVNFLGGTGDKLVFELAVQQPDDAKSTLRIRDENGVQLYSELITKKSVVKKIQVPKYELQKVEFVFSSGKDEIRKSFEIKFEYREVLEIKDVTGLQ